LAKSVLEAALDTELTEHLGHDKHDPAGHNGGKFRNSTRTKTVLTEIGPVPIEVPRDRDGSIEPRIVKKRRRRLDGIDLAGEPSGLAVLDACTGELPDPSVRRVCDTGLRSW
jgi:transposase-like protein